MVLPALCGAGLLGACGATGAPATVRADLVPVPATYLVSGAGVQVSVKVGFDEDREVTDAQLLWDGRSDEIALYPVDGTDPDVAPDTITLDRGRRVTLEGHVVAACPEVPQLPRFEVVSRHGGEEHTDRFVPDDRDAFAQAFARWCDRPVSVDVRGSSATPEGDYELRLEVTNPGPSAVEVVSRQVVGSSAWQRTAVVVLPGSIGQLTVTGHGPPDCAAVPPWETGDVLADGVAIAPRPGEAWC